MFFIHHTTLSIFCRTSQTRFICITSSRQKQFQFSICSKKWLGFVQIKWNALKTGDKKGNRSFSPVQLGSTNLCFAAVGIPAECSTWHPYITGVTCQSVCPFVRLSACPYVRMSVGIGGRHTLIAFRWTTPSLPAIRSVVQIMD